jgi:uncharacterized membrane protein YkvA (DUF1232 family)
MTNPANRFEKEYTEKRFWAKLVRSARVAGREVVEKALWLYYAAKTPATPAWAKAVIYGTLGYFILPLDAIPDFTPAVGFADDLGALVVALSTVAAHIDGDVRKRAREKLKDWFGDPSSGDDEPAV